jgi:hypothetical protein
MARAHCHAPQDAARSLRIPCLVHCVIEVMANYTLDAIRPPLLGQNSMIDKEVWYAKAHDFGSSVW